MENKRAYTVGEINQLIQDTLESAPALLNIAVTGQISEYTVNQRSGHHYFTLQDETGRISCVMFKWEAAGLRFRPGKGMKVVARGRVTVYAPNGSYQLRCSALEPDGVGALQIAYEQLVAKLRAEGLFDQARKKPLPKYPGTIAAVTSANGQAIKDIAKVLRHRFPMAKVVLLPVAVEGAEAPASLVRAMEYANRYRVADLIIIGRGGGAAATLECFNDERVARSIYASQIPVISAVGHEGNMSIADLVADRRASTPSNAAELAVPEQKELLTRLQELRLRMMSSGTQRLKLLRQQLDGLARKRVMTDPLAAVELRQQMLDYKQKELYHAMRALLAEPRQRLSARAPALEAAVRKRLDGPRQALSAQAAALDAMSPLKVLGRGFALVSGAEGKPLQRVADAPVGSRITAALSDGELRCRVEEAVTAKEKKP